MTDNEFTSSNDIITKNLKNYKKVIIQYNNNIEIANKINIIQEDISILLKNNKIYQDKYPSKCPKNIYDIIQYNNLKIIELKKERDCFYDTFKNTLKNKILKSNSPTFSNE